MNKKNKIILIILLAATLLFIWIHSMMPPDVSSGESSAVLDIIRPFLEIFVGKGNVTELLVRKLGHFSEYTVLGAELAVLFARMRNRAGVCVWKKLPMIILHGIGVSFIDETIQIFSGRGPAIVDMWIDTAGTLLGSAVALCIMMIAGHVKASK